jgi:hypothetical protein
MTRTGLSRSANTPDRFVLIVLAASSVLLLVAGCGYPYFWSDAPQPHHISFHLVDLYVYPSQGFIEVLNRNHDPLRGYVDVVVSEWDSTAQDYVEKASVSVPPAAKNAKASRVDFAYKATDGLKILIAITVTRAVEQETGHFYYTP